MSKIIIPSLQIDGYNINPANSNVNDTLIFDGYNYVPSQNVVNIQNTLSVGKSGSINYTSIKAAIDAAIAGGASLENPYFINIAAGNYTEVPFTIVPGISVGLTGLIGTVNITAANPLSDLITMTGGILNGVTLSGVTDPTKALIRCSTSGQLCEVNFIDFEGCSNGIWAENGAFVSGSNITAYIDETTEIIGTLIKGDGYDGYGPTTVNLKNVDVFVPASLASQISQNMIQYVLSATNTARVNINSSQIDITPFDSTQAAIYVDTGATSIIQSTVIRNCANATTIGAGGTNSTLIVQSAKFSSNTTNFRVSSSTGMVFATATIIDQISNVAVPGAIITGLIQVQNNKNTELVEPAIRYNSTSSADLAQLSLNLQSSGINAGGIVTAGTGLSINIASGNGWINRSTPTIDLTNISWNSTTLNGLPSNSIVFIYIDDTTFTPNFSVSLPSSQKIFLATVYTGASGIRYIHTENTITNLVTQDLQTYLFNTRRFSKNVGLGTSLGSTSSHFNVDPGSYYLGLQLISYAGATDAYFSYYYGTDGYTEVPNQNTLDNTQFDSSGTLTTMTDGYFRADSLYLTSDGRLSLIYGTAQYSLTSDAYSTAAFMAAPTFIQPSGFSLAQIVIQKNSGIISIIDRRVTPSSTATLGGGVITDHGQLTGLLDDDHPQYLLDNGARSMSGNLNMGGNSVTNLNTITDGYGTVTIGAHAVRHQPGGADAIATAVPVAILVGAAALEGSASSISRSDHQHGIGVGTPVNIGLVNSQGSASSTVRSDHVHALPAVGTAGVYTFATGDNITIDAYGRQTATTTVTRNINTAAGELTGGGSLNSDKTLGLAAAGTPGSYSYVTFDAYGREITGSLINVNTTSRLTGGGALASDLTLDLASSGLPAGNYQGIGFDAYGRATSASIISVNTISGQLIGGGDLNTTRTLGLASVGTPGTFTFATGDSVIVDAYGRQNSITTVTRNINTTDRLTGGGNLTTDRTLDLATIGTPGSYSYITTDAYGRVTAGQLNSILTTGRLTGGGDLSTTRTLDLAATAIIPSTYQGIAFDAYGRATSASLISVNTTAGQLTGGGDLNSIRTLGLAATGTAGIYTFATGDSVTFDAYGRETSATTVTRNINTAARLTGGGNLTADRTLDLATIGTPGSYSYVTIDAYGRTTAGVLNSILTAPRLTGGGDLSTTRTLDLATTGIVQNSYQGIAFDAYGRATSAGLISINTTAGQLTGGGDLNSTRTLGLAVAGTAGIYATATGDSFTFDAYGRETSVSTVTRNINTTAGQLTGGGNLSADRTLGLAPTGTSGSYSYVTFDAYGRETAGSLVSVNTTPRLTGGGPLSNNLTLDLATSGVTAGSYTVANITVDAYGRTTAASSTSVGGVPVSTSNTNSAGVGPSLAYSDHVHQTKVDVTHLALTTSATTTSLSDTPLTDGTTPLSITPGAGNWLVNFNCWTENSNNDKINYFSIYVNGIQIAVSLREVQLHTGGVGFPVSITTLVTGVTAGQAIDVRWRVNANTGTTTNRELVVIRAV